ncbi:SMP-30/gluconolactonase/LRE family protein [Noviherbaspirillum saxi]|uniref:SMP-30/gluconolactonase/LRE family protein n=1 Tax=Noviherbaspirillum saxi TaxID=2320863 RepID=A0A3A3G100_9BURK|nr:SMP-30/gluconolactonase/LRE family protein [Noviherbaspirillum saxi]RJG00142.1 SMP-30/gluconolactonase/LRE family protein [Noviherbaspirillum saxi]
MSTNEIRPVLDTPMLLGETPLWHPEESALFWIDIAGKSVHRFRPADGTHQHWNLPAEPGCIAYIEVGKLLVAMRSGLAELDTTTGTLIHLSDPPYDPSKVRFNDGRCDARGRLWAGTLFDSRERPGGSLFCVEQGNVRDIGKPVTVSNGVAFSCDGRTLYHTDTTAHRIMAYEFNVETGEVGGARLFKQFSADKGAQYGGRPDGAAVDSENAYWCAMYEGGRVLRISPDGEILREITLPVRCPTMVAFGGEDMKSLYITTVRHNRSADELVRHPLSGHVLTMHVDVPGRLEFAYRL